jgi:hypothetical protein
VVIRGTGGDFLPVFFNGTRISKIIFNGTQVGSLIYNGTKLFMQQMKAVLRRVVCMDASSDCFGRREALDPA